ncbi:MAG: hypothetical protein AABZ57_01330, partial [Candidatus Margulisiibacteriota bacterium]
MPAIISVNAFKRSEKPLDLRRFRGPVFREVARQFVESNSAAGIERNVLGLSERGENTYRNILERRGITAVHFDAGSYGIVEIAERLYRLTSEPLESA